MKRILGKEDTYRVFNSWQLFIAELMVLMVYVKQDIKDVEILNSRITDENIHITSIKVASLNIVNIFKPPGSTWSGSQLPILNYPCLYIGDFNSHHQDWGYEQNDANGNFLHDWITNNNLSLLFDAKDRDTFVSAKWGKE